MEPAGRLHNFGGAFHDVLAYSYINTPNNPDSRHFILGQCREAQKDQLSYVFSVAEDYFSEFDSLVQSSIQFASRAQLERRGFDRRASFVHETPTWLTLSPDTRLASIHLRVSNTSCHAPDACSSAYLLGTSD